MHLTLQTDFALRTLIYLATDDNAESWPSVRSIAEAYGISRQHLSKVAQRLAHGGYVETRLGRGGGLRLAKPPETIVVGEVVRYMEPSLAPVGCLAGERCVIIPACALMGALQDASDAFMAVLDRYTLADCVRKRRPLMKLLGLTRPAS